MIIRPSAPDDAARVLLFLSILMQEKCPTILQMESLPSLEEETDFLGVRANHYRSLGQAGD